MGLIGVRLEVGILQQSRHVWKTIWALGFYAGLRVYKILS